MESIENSRIRNDTNLSDNEFYETYKGYQLTCFQGILLWGGISFFVYAYINSNKASKTEALIVSICFSIYLFILCSWNMNYFQVSDSYLRILKHNLFWRKKVYKFSDIQEIVFEQRTKLGNCLKVITNDFSSRFYAAGTLSNETWFDLKNKLESYNVKVIDERKE